MATTSGDPQTPTPAPRGQPLPALSPDELGGIFNTPPVRRRAPIKTLKRARLSTADSDTEIDTTTTIPPPIMNSGEFSFDPRDTSIQHLQQQVATLTSQNAERMANISQVARQWGATAKTSSRIEAKLSTVLGNPPKPWAKVAATNNPTNTPAVKTNPAAPPATKKAQATKPKPQPTPAPIKQTPHSKRDRRISVHREAFREPVAETRLKEIRDAVNTAIQQANKTPNAPKISGVTINEKKNYILSTLGNTPASEILKYRANVEAALRKIDISVL